MGLSGYNPKKKGRSAKPMMRGVFFCGIVRASPPEENSDIPNLIANIHNFHFKNTACSSIYFHEPKWYTWVRLMRTKPLQTKEEIDSGGGIADESEK